MTLNNRSPTPYATDNLHRDFLSQTIYVVIYNRLMTSLEVVSHVTTTSHGSH